MAESTEVDAPSDTSIESQPERDVRSEADDATIEDHPVVDAPSDSAEASHDGGARDAEDDKAADTRVDSAGVSDAAGDTPDAEDDKAADARVDSADAFDMVGDAPDVSADIGGGEASPTDSCVPNCIHLGDFRCSVAADAATSRQLQACSMVRGCLAWLDTATCNDNEICCQGVCRPLASTSSCESDYYVDAQNGVDDADAGPDRGSQAHPFRTITFAIGEAQRSMAAGKRIYVRAGRYDAALGERFPLVLRNGTSLLGAGPNLVTVQGSGAFDHSTAGSYDGQLHLSLLVGDSAAPTIVSGITLRGDSNIPVTSYDGILCDRGSAPANGSTAGVTILDDVVVGPAFDNAIVAAASTIPANSGCNLRMTRSQVTGASWGLVAVGLLPGGPAGAVRVPVSVQVGDDAVGNSFSWLNTPSNFGGGIFIRPGVTNSSFRRNLITDSGFGILIDQRNETGVGTNSFTINDNNFTRLSFSGVFIWNATPSIEELNDNTFTEISASRVGAPSTAYALVLNGTGTFLPPVKKARRNKFVGNDVAIAFGDAQGVLFGTSGPVDFGRIGDPGDNVFHCNSMPSGVGGDVLIAVSGTGAIPFAGNVWDHFPVTTGIDGTATNGTDIIFLVNPSPGVDTTNGTADPSNCPLGRVPGP